MTPEKQIRALAELDGIDIICVGIGTPGCYQFMQNGVCKSKHDLRKFAELHYPDYLHSYDAIIPLIQKGWAGGIDSYNGNGFTSCVLEKQWVKDCCDSCRMNGMLKLTPAQLCEALLRATGKWEDK